MYFGFGALNFFTPIILGALLAFFANKPKFSNWLSITINFLWIFTVGVLFVALSIIKTSLKAEKRVAVNIREIFIHCIAFAIYAA